MVDIFNLVTVIGGAILIFVWLATRNKPQRNKMPPGPKGWPLIGNAMEIIGKNPRDVSNW